MYAFFLDYYIFGEDIYNTIGGVPLYPSTGAAGPGNAVGYFADSDLPAVDPDYPKGLLRMPLMELTTEQQEVVTGLAFEYVELDIGLL